MFISFITSVLKNSPYLFINLDSTEMHTQIHLSKDTHTNAQSSTIPKPTATNNTHQQVKWIEVDASYKLWRQWPHTWNTWAALGETKGRHVSFLISLLVLGTKPGNPVKLNMFSFHFHTHPPFHLLLLLMKVSYYTVLKDSRRKDHNPVHLPTSYIFKTLKHKIWCTCRSLHP